MKRPGATTGGQGSVAALFADGVRESEALARCLLADRQI